MNSSAAKNRLVTAIALTFLIGVFAFISAVPAKSGAQVNTCFLTGYAWSDTIGWISLSGPGYGMQKDESGNITGYAWSDNIGWIQAGGLSGFPAGPGTVAENAKVVGSTLVGWIRALSGNTSQSGGWDGWISLGGANPSYSVNVSESGLVSGFAWGSDVVGWIDFSSITCTANPITCDSQDQFLSGGQCLCIADPSVVATSTPTGSCPTTCLSSDQHYDPTTYQCRCSADNSLPSSNPGGICPETCTPANFCSDTNPGDLMVRSVNCTVSLVQHCAYGCASGVCLPPNPVINFTVSPSVVKKGSTATVTWSATNVSACTLRGSNGDVWSCAGSSCASVHTHSTSPILSRTSYTLSCAPLPDAPAISQVTKIVNIAPTFSEQ